MKIKVMFLVVMFLTFFNNNQIFAYIDTEEYKGFLENIDIDYNDLELTDEEIKFIEELQKESDLTYALHDNDMPVKMIFDQVSTVFGIEITPVYYDNYIDILNDVKNGDVDFTSNIWPTEERMSIYDYTTSISKEGIYIFASVDEFWNVHSSRLNDKLAFAYPEGYALPIVLKDTVNPFDFEYVEVDTVERAVELVEKGEVDIIASSISWYDELSKIEDYMGIDYTDELDIFFAGTITKKDTNKELMSIMSKLYFNSQAAVDIQRQIENFQRRTILDILNDKYKNSMNRDKIYRIIAGEYKPFVYLENGKEVGYLVELIDSIFEKLDLNYTLEVIEDESLFTELFYNMEENNIDIAMPIIYTENLLDEFTLTVPVVKSEVSVISKIENTNTQFKTVNDFSIQRLGVIDIEYMRLYVRDYINFDPRNIVYYDSIESLVEGVRAGEVTFALVNYKNFNKFAIKENIMDIVVLDEVKFPVSNITFAMPKSEEYDYLAEVLSVSSDILDKEEIELKYLTSMSEIEAIYQNRTQTLRILMITTFISSIGVITLLIWISVNSSKRANTDYLTKLKNRRTLNDDIKKYKSKKGYSIAYVDLDNFKSVNDIYGHHYGDMLLEHISELLRKISKNAIAYRIGGDEFILIYKHEKIDFSKIKSIFDGYLNIEGTSLKLEGSIGNINLDKYGHHNVADLINIVDYGMILAKRNGKNIVIEIEDNHIKDFLAISELREFLGKSINDEKIKVFIDKVSYKNDISGIKLAPICYYGDKALSYDDIERHISSKILLMEIGKLLFERMCKLISDLKLMDYDISNKYFIHKILARTVDDNSIKKMLRIAKKYNISSDEITLSISSHYFTPKEIDKTIETIKMLGCKVSVNIFSIPSSSLIYLNYINLKLIEVDLLDVMEIFTSIKFVSREELKELVNKNLFLKGIMDLINGYETEVIVYLYGKEKEDVFIDYLLENINSKIHYCDKSSHKDYNEFISNIKEVN